MDSIKVGDRVEWTTKHPRWDSLEIRFHSGTVTKIYGGYAEVARLSNPKHSSVVPVAKLNRVDPMHTPVASSAQQPDDFAETLASHRDPFGVLASLAEMEDVEASMRWAGATL